MIFAARASPAVTVGMVIGGAVPKLPETDPSGKFFDIKPRKYSVCAE